MAVRFSVVITTFNRANDLHSAVDSVLSQDESLELIVVDDGSTDSTPEVLDGMNDSRLHVVRQSNQGGGAARNAGLRQASGLWTTFLDDDDVALPGWLNELAGLADDPQAGAVCCAAQYHTPAGQVVERALPAPMGALFEHESAAILGGAFAVRTSILREIGGYDEKIVSAQQTELWLRLVPALHRHGYVIRTTDKVLVSLERRPAHERPTKDPMKIYRSTSMLLTKHPDRFALDAKAHSLYQGILGVNAARLGWWSTARRAFYMSARYRPLAIRTWIRLAASLHPRIGRKVW